MQTERLLAIMERMRTVYERLAHLAQRHKEALVAGDLAAMESVIGEMQYQLDEVERLERDRRQVTAEVARALGVDADPPRVSALADQLDPATAAHLRSIADDLQAAITELARTNETNRQLVAQAQAYQQKFMEWLAGALAANTYGPQRQGRVGGQLLDMQA
jgi:flagellar biosynthesis/type III secretory pathway chaperone